MKLSSLSCSDVTGHLSAAFDEKRSAGERLLVWMHLRTCMHCRRFAAQLALLARAMESARKEARLMSASRIPPLSYSAREKIKHAIDAELL